MSYFLYPEKTTLQARKSSKKAKHIFILSHNVYLSSGTLQGSWYGL
jgi:hypothetical protein